MRVVGVLSTKGGAGKTTVTIHLGGAATAAGLKVCYMDTDWPQGSLSKLLAERQPELPVLSQRIDSLYETLSQAQTDGYDLLVIDGTPNKVHNFQHYAGICDLIVSPLKTSRQDREGIGDLLSALSEEHRSRLWFLQNGARPKRKDVPNKKNREIRELLKGCGLNEVPIMLGARNDFEDSFEENMTVLEAFPKGAAAVEVRARFGDGWRTNYE